MIEACPECDTTDIWQTGKNLRGGEVAHIYKCRQGHAFDTPTERPRNGHSNTQHGLAKELEEMDL